MADEAAQLSVLRERQRLAIEETQEKIKQLDKFKEDYESLKKRLVSLPDKLSHDVMVPIGKMAFMPGKLVHTNEILVLLGDNWFAEQSAKQSADIVDRRIAVLNQQIDELKQQEGLIKPRLDFTSELEGMAQEKSEMFEIKEEYDPEAEKKWRVEHQRRVKEHKLSQRKEKEKKQMKKEQMTSLQNQGPSDEDLWARLDQLERQEAMGREMERRLSEDEVDLQSQSEKKLSGSKSIRWQDEEEEEGEEEEEEEESDEDEYTDEEEEEEYEMRQKTTLHFKHSASGGGQGDGADMTPAPSSSETPVITSPTDIYKYFVKSGPASILKKSPSPPTSSENASVGDSSQHPALSQPIARETPSSKAFQESVIERQLTQPPEAPNAAQPEQPTKRVSKFKAQRMQQKR